MKANYVGTTRLRSKKIRREDGTDLWVDFEHDIKMQNQEGQVVATWLVGFNPDFTEAWYCGPREIPFEYNHLFDDVAALAKEDKGDSEDSGL